MVANHRRVVNTGLTQVGRRADGTVTFDDPASPWEVAVRVGGSGESIHIQQLVVTVRPGGLPITSSRLARLPVQRMRHLAAAAVAQPTHPNEVYYRMLAAPRPVGRRQWPEDHWSRVAEVFNWAERTGRPGGGSRAIADLWQVSINPTVYRWLARVRELQAAQ